MEATDGRQARRNFTWILFLFSLTHGCVTTPVVYASSLLDERTGYLGNALLYVATFVSSLLVAVPAVNALGLKASLMWGMSLYSVYAGCFAWALCSWRSVHAQRLLFCAGSVLGGLAAGVTWTVQGGFLSRTASKVARSEDRPREEITGELAAHFACYYLSCEALTKVSFSLLQYAGVPEWKIGMLFFAVSVACTVLVSRAADLPVEAGSAWSKLTMTVKLWARPTIWLLSPINITFGCSAAYMNGVFNSLYAEPQLGSASIGLLSAVTVSSAAVLSRALQVFAPCFGKGGLLTFGAVAFMSIPLASVLSGGLQGWGWRLLVFYVLQGCGRAVYESTNKAIFSDFFKGEETEAAFANCNIQMSVACAVCFFCMSSSAIDKSAAQMSGQEWVLVGVALITPVAFALAQVLRGPQDPEECRPLAKSLGAEAAEAERGFAR